MAATTIIFWTIAFILGSTCQSVASPEILPKQPQICSPHIGCILGIYSKGFQTEYYETYLGIPYALPPIDELRFSSPKPYPKFSEIYNASLVKTECIQKNYLLPNHVISGVEDCLYLNVFKPMNIIKKEPVPVMVYIHGGGWFGGSATPNLHGPEYFMDAQEVILVTMAYRLGAFGFLSTNDSNMPGNFGLKDQNMALKWVQANIASFGGNPKRVTIFGQSAGAVSAHMHMLSKLSEGLFHSVIALSGTANVPFAITENPLEQARRTAELCNISNAYELSSEELTTALRAVDALTLLNAGDGLKYWDVDPMTNYRPVVEPSGLQNAFMTEHPRVTLESGQYKAVPFLVGGVPHEGAVRVLSILENEKLRHDFNLQFDNLLEKLMDWPANFNSTQLKESTALVIAEYFGGQHELNDETWHGFLDLVSDRAFHEPLYNTLRQYVEVVDTAANPIYMYMFSYQGSKSFSHIYTGGHISRNYGVVHCDDLLYLFRSPMFFADFGKKSKDAAVIKAFVNYLIYFARFAKTQNEELTACNKFNFAAESDTICDYEEFVNVNGTAAFEIKTKNKFNMKRMQMWNDILKKKA